MVAAVLYESPDPETTAKALAELLCSGDAGGHGAQALGLEPTLVSALANALPADPGALKLACVSGAAWVLGRRSAVRTDKWELVASLPPDARLPGGLRRTTGETLVALVSEAEHIVRVVAPYVDSAGLGLLVDVLAAATERGVVVEVFQQSRWGQAEWDAVATLRDNVATSGNRSLIRVVKIREEAPFAHLKVVTADHRRAYIGSANMTAAALMGRNIELGVLLLGTDVSVIERLLDLYRET
jgi:phosphatidylserine/phosphatidylglycerophosphate/cardiolipin synthase-like enzyme